MNRPLLRLSSIPLLLILFFVLSLASPRASAHPTNFDCSTGCFSKTYWAGTVQGALVRTIVSNPGLHNTTAAWDRLEQVYGSEGGIHTGFEKITKGTGGYCTGGGGLFWFAYGYDQYNDIVDNYCQAVPSGCINTQMTIQISPYVSNGGGIEIQIYGPCGNMIPQYFPYVNGIGHNYSYMQFAEQIYDNVQGHEVWGSNWVNSEYQQNGSWHYQSRGVDYLSSRNPPQMYWKIEPTSTNAGGSMYSCVYDSGSYNCVLGA